MSYPAPAFDFPAGRNVARCYVASEGTPGRLTDLMDSGDPLAWGTSLPLLKPTGTPSGRPCLQLSGGTMTNAGTGTNLNRRYWWGALLARLTGEGTILNFGSGAATLAVSGQLQTLTVGGSAANSNRSPGQWGVYFWYVAPAAGGIIPFFQGYNFSGGTAPTSAALSGSVSIPATFAGDFGGLMYGEMASAADYFESYELISQVIQYFYRYGMYSPASPLAMVESNSIGGEITVAGAATCWPTQMQALLGTAGQVVNFSCSSAYLDPMVRMDRVKGAYDPTKQQVMHFAEGNNGLLFGTYAGDGAALYAAEKAYLQAIKAACPRLVIVHYGPPTRNAVTSGGNQTTYNAARAAYNLARDSDAGTALAGDNYTYTSTVTGIDYFVKADQMPGFSNYTSTSFQGDETHLSTLGHGYMAASAAFVQQYATRRADRLILTNLTAPAATASAVSTVSTAVSAVKARTDLLPAVAAGAENGLPVVDADGRVAADVAAIDGHAVTVTGAGSSAVATVE